MGSNPTVSAFASAWTFPAHVLLSCQIIWIRFVVINVSDTKGGGAVRHIAKVGTKKVSKSVLVVTDAKSIRPKMEEIRELDYECTMIEDVGGAMSFLRDGERVNIVVIYLKSERSAEKLIRWITENRGGVCVVCILNANLSDFGPKAAGLGATVLAEKDVAKVHEFVRNLLSQQTR